MTQASQTPPQSTPVSSPFWTKSKQDGARQNKLSVLVVLLLEELPLEELLLEELLLEELLLDELPLEELLLELDMISGAHTRSTQSRFLAHA
jgi:hypothetical protein